MTAPAKFDLLQQFRADYVAPKKPAFVMLAPARYLAITGRGRPGDETFTAHIGALYAVAFTTKMQRKFAGLGDYTVGKLEARWPDFAPARKTLHWELLIRTPECVTAEDLARTAATLRDKRHATPFALVRLVTIDEGRCVQMLHVGPYDQESGTLGLMTRFATAKGLRAAAAHHEIYLSDPRRVPPERLRTILRMPVTER